MLFYLCNIFYHMVERFSLTTDVDMVGLTTLKPHASLYELFNIILFLNSYYLY